MANADVELSKMIRAFRVSDLQSLLSYAGRNKGGKKYDLQNRALDLLKLRSSAIEMKIREIYHNRHNQARSHGEPHDMYTMPPSLNDAVMSYSSRSSHQGPLGGPGMSSYVPSMGKHLLGAPSHLNILPQYPVNPDVHFKELPFYEVLAELLKPTSLITLPNERFQEREFGFCFTPQQLLEFQHNMDVQVQLRICLLDPSCEQDDEIPSSICLKINQKVCNLPNPIPTNKPGAEPKRPKYPIDITNVTKRTATEPNEVHISWASSSGKPYVLGVFLVRKQTSSHLMRKLKGNGVRNPDHTTAMIKEKLLQDRDSEIATMSLRGSLMCPLGKIKMKLPCRALTCTHLQCFDATLYLQMNEKKPKWICPVCDKPALYKNLAIDGLFLDIVSKAPSECTEVQFHEDGSWTPVMPIKKQPEINDASFEAPPKDIPKVESSKPKRPIEVISLDSDSDTEDSWPILPPKKKMIKTSNEMSPVLLESPEESQNSEDAAVTSFDPYAPCSSKTESCSKLLPIIPDKSSLPPLPEALDIDTSDVDCLVGSNPSILAGPSSSNYESLSPVSSPKSFCQPSVSKLSETSDILQAPEEEEGSPDIINID
ncbi:E3 SUMO-protein ligase PIAS1 like protein [Argiope bruennichi]|uniref:E3 SUMO-protein ligase PIAS1 like protein n=1 Tax=Argiope bruennichi TaxID=94029 RepID=A0A8T0EV27_ARGBR|nr:E3 SUMO-protein ligase PIAS1 like protein [Argiope bruennichi]